MNPFARASHENVRKKNRAAILRHLVDQGPVSRVEIAKSLGLTESAVSRITRELLGMGILREGNTMTKSGIPGRRSVELELASDGGYVAGLGAGAYEQCARLSNIRGELIDSMPLNLLGSTPPLEALDMAAEAIKTLAARTGVGLHQLHGLGVSISGVIDADSGTIISSPNLGWKGVPVAAYLSRELGIPVRVESPQNTINLAEARFGLTKTVDDILLVFAVLGVGASMIVNGQLARGGFMSAGQIGHFPVSAASELCTCGQYGCLDTVASGHAVLIGMDMIEPRIADSKHGADDPILLTRAMDMEREGNKKAVSSFFTAGLQLGRALGIVVPLFDPKKIVLAGRLAQVSSYRNGFNEGLSELSRQEKEILISNLTSEEAAVLLALDSFVFSENLRDTGNASF